MTRLEDEIGQTLLPGMSIPQALKLLFAWIESNELFIDTDRGKRIGFLFPQDEICWNEELLSPPNANLADSGYFVRPNVEYQQWVRQTFSVDIPNTANEIVKCPSEMGDLDSSDPFFRWVEQNV